MTSQEDEQQKQDELEPETAMDLDADDKLAEDVRGGPCGASFGRPGAVREV